MYEIMRKQRTSGVQHGAMVKGRMPWKWCELYFLLCISRRFKTPALLF